MHAVHGVHQSATRRGFAHRFLHPDLFVSGRLRDESTRDFSGVSPDQPSVQDRDPSTFQLFTTPRGYYAANNVPGLVDEYRTYMESMPIELDNPLEWWR